MLKKLRGEEEEELAIAEVEGMPPWAAAMQKTLMQHTSNKHAQECQCNDHWHQNCLMVYLGKKVAIL